eukprot:scaffold13150_cov125-Isochrysis_galbana.AAC.4
MRRSHPDGSMSGDSTTTSASTPRAEEPPHSSSRLIGTTRTAWPTPCAAATSAMARAANRFGSHTHTEAPAAAALAASTPRLPSATSTVGARPSRARAARTAARVASTDAFAHGACRTSGSRRYGSVALARSSSQASRPDTCGRAAHRWRRHSATSNALVSSLSSPAQVALQLAPARAAAAAMRAERHGGLRSRASTSAARTPCASALAVSRACAARKRRPSCASPSGARESPRSSACVAASTASAIAKSGNRGHGFITEEI